MTFLSRAREKSRFRKLQHEEQPTRAGVCVVDDDQDTLSALSNALRDDGYRVIEAADGAEVLELLAHHWGPMSAIDVIITDQVMPGITGLELLDELRHHNWHTQVILMSAFANDKVRREAHRLGAAAVLSKPFLLDDLLGEVNRLAPGG